MMALSRRMLTSTSESVFFLLLLPVSTVRNICFNFHMVQNWGKRKARELDYVQMHSIVHLIFN